MSYDFHEVPSEHSTVIYAHSRSFSLASRHATATDAAANQAPLCLVSMV